MGKTKTGRLHQPVPLRTAWPLAETLEEYAGDSAILNTPKYQRFQKYHPNSLDEYSWKETEELFQKKYRSYIQEGLFDEILWRDICIKLHLQYETKHESCEQLSAQKQLSDALLSDICEDHLPQIGLFSDELIFGPLSESWLPYSMRQLGGAICAMLPLLEHGHSAIAKLSSQRPKISPDIYSSLTAYHRTPFMLWKKKENSKNQTNDRVEPLLPLGTQYIPEASVKNLPSTDYFLGKIIKLGDHFVVSCAFGLENIQEILFLRQILTSRLRIEWIRYQRYSRITWEDILRERGDILYRTASEFLFETTK